MDDIVYYITAVNYAIARVEKLLELPVLYLSNFFRKHWKIYYERLGGYHDEDARIEAWLDFFVDDIIEIVNYSIIWTTNCWHRRNFELDWIR